jgi:hypothetical protein
VLALAAELACRAGGDRGRYAAQALRVAFAGVEARRRLRTLQARRAT